MIDPWIASALLVTPAASRATSAQLLAQVSGNPHDAAPDSFSIPVCALAGADVTHWACHTRLRRSSLAALEGLASLIPGSLWCVTSHDEDDDERAAARPAIDDYLSGHGLQRHTPPDEDL